MFHELSQKIQSTSSEATVIISVAFMLFFGFLLYITIIGTPWRKQHFKMAGLSLAPFDKVVELRS